jgi:hypothetical protein
MKKIIALIISTVLLGSLSQAAFAQGPEFGPDAPGFEKRKKFSGRPDDRRGNFGDRQKHPGGKKYVEAWLERLKESDPGEYDRLDQLREEQPEAFRQELRARLQQERTKKVLKDFPQIAETLENMSPEERQRFLKRFGQRHRPEPGEERQEVFRELHQQIRKLAEAYAMADNEDLREDIRTQLKARLGQMHETQLQVRKQHLQNIEKEVEKLRSSIEQEQQNRDAFIEEHLNRILRADTPNQPFI